MDMCKWARITPAINQVESHPYLVQEKLMTFCKSKGIQITAFSPLGCASYSWLDRLDLVLKDPAMEAIAARYQKSVAQICIRWQVQRGNTVVPKSCNPERLSQNLDVFNFELTDNDMAAIAALNKDRRCVPPPPLAYV